MKPTSEPSDGFPTVDDIPVQPWAKVLSVDAPPDKDCDSGIKTTIARLQLTDHLGGREMACAKCRLVRPIQAFYRCRYCGVWYCGTCADAHFRLDADRRVPAAVKRKPWSKWVVLARGKGIAPDSFCICHYDKTRNLLRLNISLPGAHAGHARFQTWYYRPNNRTQRFKTLAELAQYESKATTI